MSGGESEELSRHLPVTDDELEAMLTTRLRVKRMHCSPLDREIGVRALSDHEVDLAKIEAQRYCKKLGADIEMDPEFLEREKERQIVWRCIVEPHEPHRRLFASDDDVRKKCDSALIRALSNMYSDALDELTPIVKLTEEEVDVFVTSLGKEQGAPSLALRLYEHASLRSLVLILASRLRELI